MTRTARFRGSVLRARQAASRALASVAALALALLCASRTAHAEGAPPPAIHGNVYSPYELETIAAALASSGAHRDPSPEGKIIEAIDIVPLDVLEERDPAPKVLNAFHATTRQYVVDREVLLRPGDAYQQVLIDETVRNLRALPQLSLVVAIAVTGSAPERVRLLVLTKDVWSLRLAWNLVLTQGGLDDLVIQPSETNLLGSHQTASAFFELLPASYTLGAGYRIPRLGGSRVVLLANADVVMNRASGAPEGSYGSLIAGQPLYSALTEWSWDATTAWQDVVTRRYVDAHLSHFTDAFTPSNNGLPVASQGIPWEYRSEIFTETYSATRSFGWANKHDISLGGGVDRRVYRTADLSAFDPRAVGDFVRRQVPVSDTRVGPFVQYHAYATRYLRVLDFETLGLQEDYRLGHDAYVRFYPSLQALGASRDTFGIYAAAQYTVPIRDGLARLGVESVTEPEPDRLADASIASSLHVVTPRLDFGRLVFDAHVLHRYRNYLNRTSFLGGNTRLRGYPTNFAVGKDVVDYNLEFRTRPLKIYSVMFGAAAFYDVGDAFDGWSEFRPKQAVGAGLRVLFPQLDRVVFRADVGVPVGEGARLPGVSPIAFVVAFEQAFGVPAVGPTAALPASVGGR